MAVQRKPITPHGLRKLKKELRRIREVERPANVRAIEEALDHGDLSENAEYKYAKEQQSFIAGRLKELEGEIARAQVIDPASLSGERVVFGATVALLDLDTDDEVTYTIVGHTESDVSKGRVSVSSPIARGMIGKFEGDEVHIETPKGARQFEVLSIAFNSTEDWE